MRGVLAYKPRGMRRQGHLLAWTLSAALGCPAGAPEQRSTDEWKTEIIELEESPSPYPAVEPSEVTPLDVLYISEYTGEGYARRPVQIGKSLHSGKYLGFANGQAEFFGHKHIIVDHLRSRPRNPFLGDIEKSVLLDIETGEVVTEFARYGRPIQWSGGLAIVYRAGDDRPHLLDAKHHELVLAVPEGEHDYRLGENYWIKFSWADDWVWIYARDAEGGIHLYEWEDRRRPPELPNNPFPFFPDNWDSGADADEVTSRSAAGCDRAILIPPKRWVCLEGDLADTVPLSQGWRLDRDRSWVFNHRDGRGYDLSMLCPTGVPVRTGVMSRDPAHVKIGCEGDKSVWMVWMAPDRRVQRLDPELAVRVNSAQLLPLYFERFQRFEMSEFFPEDIYTRFDSVEQVIDLVGTDFACPEIEYLPGPRSLSGVACRRSGGPRIWFELVSVERNLRSRFRAIDLAVGRTGAVGIVRRNNRDHVVPLSIK
jgi:hypothetical protein